MTKKRNNKKRKNNNGGSDGSNSNSSNNHHAHNDGAKKMNISKARNNKRKKLNLQPNSSSTSSSSSSYLTTTPTSSSSSYNTNKSFPIPYPHSPNRPLPKNAFLRYIEPYKDSFQTALDTSYLGFEIDKEEENQQTIRNEDNDISFNNNSIEKALLTMDRYGLFRTDVTQPFGLGTKCAKTYVTRCLVGEEGTTYKYLGLRMFAHPWGGKKNSLNMDLNSKQERKIKKKKIDKNSKNDENVKNEKTELEKALNSISQLNNSLTERTALHLDNLEKKRKRKGKGRAKFDVALINRMIDTKDLKKEPSMGDGRCSVSWHADSSLEHYSSIAVYHTILNQNKVDNFIHGHDDSHSSEGINENDKHSKSTKVESNESEDKDHDMSSQRWSIALRVAHDSEGPGSSNRGSDITSSVVTNTPSIAISLPSRSAYYLLDDFNHHHQHAVLVNDNNNNITHNDDKHHSPAGVRFASTHRLLREGHNVYFILNRCRNACSQFHKKGPKVWRSEQLLLTEIESEWIRQFFIQGEGHRQNLWKYWKEPISQLLKYWSRLEHRTKQVIDILHYAAKERCRTREGGEQNNINLPLKRKERDKQKKSLATIEDILSRGGKDDNNSVIVKSDALNSIYIPMSMLLEERSNMRMLWDQRQNDRVFKSMPSEYKPIIVPFQFNVIGPANNTSSKNNTLQDIHGESPLSGSYQDLKRTSEDLKQFGVAFMSQEFSHLPNLEKTSMNKDEISKESIPAKDEISKEIKLAKDSDLSERNVVHDKEDQGMTLGNDTISCKYKSIVAKESNNQALLVKPKSANNIKLNPDEHKKDFHWSGWRNQIFGLEMQHPWSRLLLNGTKTIETRLYDLPKDLIGRKIFILESQPGKDGVSSIGNVLDSNDIERNIKTVGWVKFDRVSMYRYRAKFEADEKKHLVKRDSGYGWKEDTKLIYGWVVASKGKYKDNCGKKQSKKPQIKSMIRRMRSLFSVQLSMDS